MKDRYSRGRWEPNRERWPPGRSDGGWNQSWDRAPYSDYLSGQPQSFSYDWQHADVPHRPRSIQVAVVLMCVGAGLDGLGFIFNLIGIHGWVIGYAMPLNRGAPGLAAVHATSMTSGIGSALGSVLGIALWLWMASANRAGQSWARTASTVFFVIATLGVVVFLLALSSEWHLAAGSWGLLSTPVLVAVLYVLGVWVLRLTIIVLLWRKESSAYYAGR